MPPGLDQDDRSVRFQAGVDVVVEPIPHLVAISLALRIRTVPHRIVYHYKARTESRNARSYANRPNRSAAARFPFR